MSVLSASASFSPWPQGPQKALWLDASAPGATRLKMRWVSTTTLPPVCWVIQTPTSNFFLVISPQFSYDVDQCQVPDESTPTGVKWLCHPKAMQTYLSLLGSSQKDATLEASCGALQNLTAGKGLVSTKKIIIGLTICDFWMIWDSFTKGENRISRNNDSLEPFTRKSY